MTVVDPESEQTQAYSPRPMPGVGMVEAMRRHWRFVLAPIIVLLAVAAIIGASYKATYTAGVRLNVGRLDVATQSIPGYSAGIQSLAVAYARVVTAEGVVDPVATKLHRPRGQVAGHLQASPVPLAPLIILTATAKTARGAVDLANTAADQLVAYLAQVNRVNPDAQRVLSQYTTETAQLNALRDRLQSAKGSYAGAKTVANRRAVLTLGTQVQAMSLRVSALQSAYLSSQAGQNSTSLVQVLNRAHSASSNKRSRLEALLLGGFVVGLLVGIAFAVSRSRSAVRRVLSPQ
jgi:capsular polysaccharide biosynthesis protein